MRQTSTQLGLRHPSGIAFTHARVLDVERGTISNNMSVLTRNGRVESIRPDSEFVALRGTRVVNARGQTLMPGLWDLGQARANEFSGALTDGPTRSMLSHGVTSVMELAGDTLFTPRIEQRVAGGEQIGPSIVPACLVNGWVPDTIGGVVPRFRGWQGQVRDAGELRTLIGRCRALGMRVAERGTSDAVSCPPPAVGRAAPGG